MARACSVQRGQLHRLELRRGQPGKASEGVDGAPEPLHLLEHRRGALDEEGLEPRVVDPPGGEQRLQRHLQRGERVPQLVGEAPGHPLPGRRLLRGPERAGGVPEVLGHPVEGVDQHPHLAAALGRHPGVERSAGDRPHALGQRLHRTGDAAGEEEARDQGQQEPERAGGEQGTEQASPASRPPPRSPPRASAPRHRAGGRGAPCGPRRGRRPRERAPAPGARPARRRGGPAAPPRRRRAPAHPRG